MPDYRRYLVPEGTYFFTINLLERRADGAAYRSVAGGSEVHASRSTVPYRCLGRASRSFALRDYPTANDDDFSNRIKVMKIRFVQALPPTEGRSSIRTAKGERGIWQRRF